MSSDNTSNAAAATTATTTTATTFDRIGFIGLGKIGYAIAKNIIAKASSNDNGVVVTNGFLHYDIDSNVCEKLTKECPISTSAKSIGDLASQCDVVFTILPNDAILNKVCHGNDGLISKLRGSDCIHVSCSTVSPDTSRNISKLHHETNGAGFVAAPVFARPDGMALGHATIPVSGSKDEYVDRIVPLLKCTATEVRTGFGTADKDGEANDPGAANVVKLAGNFLIASAIESLGEAMAFTEGCGIKDRDSVRELLTDTIFDCLIYKGYGQRVAKRDHTPYPNAHFGLDLGRKDVELINTTAKSVNVPMPIAGLLSERYTTAIAKDRSNLDWSAIGLQSSEDSGIDVSKYVDYCNRPNPTIDWKPPT